MGPIEPMGAIGPSCGDTRWFAEMHTIGMLNEKRLHAALKEHQARPGGGVEVKLHGYVVDVARDYLCSSSVRMWFKKVEVVEQQGCSDSCALSGDGPLPGEPVACQRWQVRNGEAAKAQATHCVRWRVGGRLHSIGWSDNEHREVGRIGLAGLGLGAGVSQDLRIVE